MSHEGRQDLEIARDWLHLNHSFHDVIYRAADVPLIERMAKAARRTFLVKPVGRPGQTSTSCTSRTIASTARFATRSPRGARRALASSRASTSLFGTPARGDPGQGFRAVARTIPLADNVPAGEEHPGISSSRQDDDVGGKAWREAADASDSPRIRAGT